MRLNSRVVLGAILALGGCAGEPPPLVLPADDLHPRVVDWAEGAKDMVWSHTVDGPPPDLPLHRVEICNDFAIVFFDASARRPFIPDGEGGHIDGDLLWAAGSLSQPPEGADGGWVPHPRDRVIEPYRAAHAPCETRVVR